MKNRIIKAIGILLVTFSGIIAVTLLSKSHPYWCAAIVAARSAWAVMRIKKHIVRFLNGDDRNVYVLKRL